MRCIRKVAALPVVATVCLLPLACGSPGTTWDDSEQGGTSGAGGESSSTDEHDGDPDPRGMSGAAADDEERSVFSSEDGSDSLPKPPRETPSNDPKLTSCDPAAEDFPDDDFEDTNCDGIDGRIDQAVFVRPDGDDLGQGSPDEPLRTIGAAISLAQTQEKDVYLCNGTYDAGVVVEHDAVDLYGGYDCEDGWRRVPARATVAPSSGTALTLRGVSGMTIERVVFEGVAADVPGGSSVAGLIVDSRDVRLRRVEFVGKEAADGVAGAPGREYSSPAPAGVDGRAGCNALGCEDPGRGGTSTTSFVCPGGEQRAIGGWGGKGATQTTAFGAGENASGTLGGRGGSGDGSRGTVQGIVLVNAEGEPGGTGRIGGVGAPARLSVGHFSGEHYQPTNVGASGTHGRNGGGGGGGAGGPARNQRDLCCAGGHGGSQGGFGGCGGYPGEGGSGGGGSFGLVLTGSEVSLSWTRFITGEGGRGGAGGPGGSGQLGGLPGDVYPYDGVSQSSGRGGRGGQGGRGGNGSPGGGGPSIALALSNSSLSKSEETQVILENPGVGGPGVTGLDGPDGLAAEIYDFDSNQVSTFRDHDQTR